MAGVSLVAAFFLGLSVILGLLAWFIVSLVLYIKAPKDTPISRSRGGMLTASAIVLGAVITIAAAIVFLSTVSISFM